ncbi:MAG: hypothetical protein ACKOCE_00840 [Acidimicrobiia bacterium]
MEELTPRARRATTRITRSIRRSGARRRVLAVVVIVVIGLYWWWPGLVGDHARQPAVLVVGNGELSRGEEKVLRRLREEGYSAVWSSPVESWCDVAAAVDGPIRSTRAIVVHVEDQNDDCRDDAVGALVDASRDWDTRLIVVVGLVEDDRDVVSVLPADTTVVDPVELIGEPSRRDAHVDCLWWDDCVVDGEGTGYVVVRDDGGLTAAGQQRVARAIVAAVQ